MLFKSIERIKEALPELVHFVMFYDDGTIFQTTFEQPVNIPQLGENLSECLQHIQNLFKLTNLKSTPYKRLIYETADLVFIILKLGERSNLALFFQKGEEKPKISAIRRYLDRIEELIDTDKLSLERHTLGELKAELNKFQQKVEANLQQIAQKKQEISNLDQEIQRIEGKIEAKQKELKFSDVIQEEIEKNIERQKEELQKCMEKKVKKELKREIKEDKKGLKVLEKSLSKEEKEIQKMKSNIKTIEQEKANILCNINAILEENKKIQQKISEKSAEISALEEKINKMEKEKFERKLLT